jgi:hypothetical protein
MEPLSGSDSSLVMFRHPGIRAIFPRATATKQQNLRRQ